jgi:hypothetical protein
MNQKYLDYLQSPEWKWRRRRAMKGPGGSCFGCHKRVPLEVHHLSYKRIFREKRKDLVALCSGCHGRLHKDFPHFMKMPRKQQLLAIRIAGGQESISKWKTVIQPSPREDLYEPRVYPNGRIRKARYASPQDRRRNLRDRRLRKIFGKDAV